MNLVMLGNVKVTKKEFYKNEGKKPFLKLIVVPNDQKDQKGYFVVQAYEKLAENTNKYVVPGSRINVEGTMKLSPRTTKHGDQAYDLLINARTIDYISSPKGKDENSSSGEVAPTATEEVATETAAEESAVAETAVEETNEAPMSFGMPFMNTKDEDNEEMPF